jgi:hypothetical protein
VLCCKCGGVIDSIKDEECILGRHFKVMTTVPSCRVNFTAARLSVLIKRHYSDVGSGV